jgi:hypothetical protein
MPEPPSVDPDHGIAHPINPYHCQERHCLGLTSGWTLG